METHEIWKPFLCLSLMSNPTTVSTTVLNDDISYVYTVVIYGVATYIAIV